MRNNLEGLRELQARGADFSKSGKINLFESAFTGKVKDQQILLRLARTVPLEEKRRYETLYFICGMGDTAVLDAYLKRIGGLPADKGTQVSLLGQALYHADKAMFWHLVELGATCAGPGYYGTENRLTQRAFAYNEADPEIMAHLAENLLVKENGHEALLYSSRAGNHKAVRTLLDRGVTPREGFTVTVDEKDQAPAEAEKIRALLRERGFTVEEKE